VGSSTRSFAAQSAAHPDAMVAAVCSALQARAAGYWRIEGQTDRLIQVAFVPGVGLAAEVGREFAAATLSIPLSQTNLGIVAAVVKGVPAISRNAELPGDSGSGRWLRAFGAARSVAVPIRDHQGAIQGVLSVALTEENSLDDQAVADQLGRIAGSCPGLF
jgi:hypothetical protein